MKSQAHEALSVFLTNEGVPPVMVMDGSKEQLLGEFRRKLKEAMLDYMNLLSTLPMCDGGKSYLWATRNHM